MSECDSRSWFASQCVCECGYNVVVTQPSPESGMDCWWYCSNKLCKNHVGEQTGDMEKPDWLRQI